MLRVQRSPKYSKKYKSLSDSATKKLPDNWLDFVPLTEIRGGSGIQKFTPYDYQKELIKVIEKPETRSIVVAKSRQMGITEVISNYMLFRACSDPGFFGLILSMGQSSTSNIARRIRRMIESLAEFVEPATDNLQDITIKFGGRIKFANAGLNACRGLSVSVLFIDEAAFIPEIQEIYKSVVPTMAAVKNAKVILVSTPNTQSDFFFDTLSANNGDRDVLTICQQIRNDSLPPIHYFTDTKGMVKFFLHYRCHPVYGKDPQYLETIADRFQMTQSAVEQEFNLNFDVSDQTIFSASEIRAVATGSWSDEVKKEDSIYFIGIDSAMMGDDYTVCVVVREDLKDKKLYLEQMYRKRKQTHQSNIFHISELIKKYNPVAVAVETNSVGEVFYQELQEQNLSIEFKPIRTSQSSKPIMIGKLKLLIERELLILPDDQTVINEFLSFVKNGNKLEAISSKHRDDIVLALAFVAAIWLPE